MLCSSFELVFPSWVGFQDFLALLYSLKIFLFPSSEWSQCIQAQLHPNWQKMSIYKLLIFFQIFSLQNLIWPQSRFANLEPSTTFFLKCHLTMMFKDFTFMKWSLILYYPNLSGLWTESSILRNFWRKKIGFSSMRSYSCLFVSNTESEVLNITCDTSKVTLGDVVKNG